MDLEFIEVNMNKCKEIMTQSPLCCVPEDLPEKAVEIMKAQNVGSIPIINNYVDQKLIGIITDRDIALKVVGMGYDPKQTFLHEIMSKDPFYCNENDDVDLALELMAEHQIRRIPIVDGEGRIKGIIAQSDIALSNEESQMKLETIEEISKPNKSLNLQEFKKELF